MFEDLPGFLFAGTGTLPGVLAFNDEPGLAMIAFVALLLAGCLAALADPQAPCRAAGRDAPRKRD